MASEGLLIKGAGYHYDRDDPDDDEGEGPREDKGYHQGKDEGNVRLNEESQSRTSHLRKRIEGGREGGREGGERGGKGVK